MEANIRVERTIPAPIEWVFDAFVTSEVMNEWGAPTDHKHEHVEIDPTVGGRYRRDMRFPDGSLQIKTGEYEEITRPTRLVYSFRFETMAEMPDTKVTVDFRPEGSGANVVVTQGPFPSAEHGQGFQVAWAQCLDQLAALGGEGPMDHS